MRPEGRFCYTEYLIATKPTEARVAVFRRDRGVCANCQQDVSKPATVGWKKIKDYVEDQNRPVVLSVNSRAWGNATMIYPVEKPRWDVDHINPIWMAPKRMTIAERDSFWGMSNLQTLCVTCHREKSAEETKLRHVMATRSLLPVHVHP